MQAQTFYWADAMVGDCEKCLSIDMNDYINKPFKEDDIAVVIDTPLSSLSCHRYLYRSVFCL